MNRKIYEERLKIYKEQIKRKERMNKLNSDYWKLNEFLRENQNKFKNKESIEALKRINAYFETTQKELTKLQKEIKIARLRPRTDCKHEIILKNANQLECLICGCDLFREDVDCELKIDLGGDVYRQNEIYNKVLTIFDEIIKQEGDIVEEMIPLLEELQYESDIKIYRRSL